VLNLMIESAKRLSESSGPEPNGNG
jgi:hypothetical protein